MVMKSDELMRSPETAFRDPQRLLENAELSDEQKIRLLMNWRLDLLELDRAAEESMASTNDTGKVAERLSKVNVALDSLGARPEDGSPL